MDNITSNRVRPLSLSDLGLDVAQAEAEGGIAATAQEAVEPLEEDDSVLVEVRAALAMGFAGVILSGPPGTGKSWYGERIAHTLASNSNTVRVVQFHPSYQYEDFMQGYVPAENGGFVLEDKSFAQICRDASNAPDLIHVILIDEISRCDVARVFGEALTYIEVDKRGIEFTLASGEPLIVPGNLIVLATMNPWDKGVDELDVALERRFAQIDILPNAEVLRSLLAKRGAGADLVERVASFFEWVQQLDDDAVRLGHAYFINCVSEDTARRAWRFRLLPFFKKACRLDKEMLNNVIRRWGQVFPEANGDANVGVNEADLPPAEPAL